MENTRTLGPSESKVVLSLREQGRSLVTTREIRDALGIATSEGAARKVIRNLVRKGWLSRIIGGKYMLLPPEHGPENLGENNSLALAAAAVSPSYVGWWSAASWHGFTTQKPMTVFVAVLRQKKPRLIEGNEVRFISVGARKFFGFQSYDVYGRQVQISSKEKTLVDCLDRPELAGGITELTRITYAALRDIDTAKLVEMALKMHSTAALQRLGFLAELVGRPLPDDLRSTLKSAIPNAYRSHFGREKSRDGDIGYVSAWNLKVHASKSDLLSEVPKLKTSRQANHAEP